MNPASKPTLPPFADEWIRQWKQAAPKLQAIRDEELRRRGNQSISKASGTARAAGVLLYDRYPERHGMVIMQRWFMRRYLLEQVASQKNQTISQQTISQRTAPQQTVQHEPE